MQHPPVIRHHQPNSATTHHGLPRFARSDDFVRHREERSDGLTRHREERSDMAIHAFFGSMRQVGHLLGITSC